jgi:rSAM-associated Gly-rich repeat protein
LMSLRQKYLKILSGMASVGAVGASLLLGSAAPAVGEWDPAAEQPRMADGISVSQRLAAIREAVSDVVGPNQVERGRQLAWWANGGWRNGGWRNGGWRNGGWRNGGWRNFWRNW